MKAEKIIVKRDPARNGGRYIMFFADQYKENGPHYFDKVPAYYSADNMGNYCHGITGYNYYLECKPVSYTDVDVVKFVTDYVKYVRTLPDMADYTIKMVKRLSRK